MRRIVFCLFVTMHAIIASWADGTVTMDLTNILLRPGNEDTLAIELTNLDDDITGFQCDLYLPQGITIKKNTHGELISQVTDRINTDKPHVLTWAKQDDGAMRLLNYSTTNQLYKGKNGAVVKVVLVADKNMLPGSYNIDLKNIVVCRPKGDVIPLKNIVGNATVLPAEYSLTYILDGIEYYKENISVGDSILAKDAPLKEGYTFSGWKDVPATMPAHDVTCTGSFTVNQYSVKFVVDGDVVSRQIQDYGTDITLPEAPKKEGYTFSGWGDVPKTIPARDTVFTAHFKVNHYTVTFMVDGKEYQCYEVDYGNTITMPEVPLKEGYEFVGWGEVPETMPAQDLAFVAEFRKLFVRGDVNEDETINSADVVSVYNFIINSTDSGITFDNADVNANGFVNSSDVVEIYNIIINE